MNSMTAIGHRGVASAPAEVATRTAPWGFPEVFVISQTALPALLYLPGTQAFRLSIRVAAFAISLARVRLVADHVGRQAAGASRHSWVAAVMGLLAVMLFHPTPRRSSAASRT